MLVQAPPKVCDKCSGPVEDTNNALFLDCLLPENADAIFAPHFHQPRHLLPTTHTDANGNVVVCPGSPSRAQYLEGQPRDEKSPYNPARESLYRHAFQRLKSGETFSPTLGEVTKKLVVAG